MAAKMNVTTLLGMLVVVSVAMTMSTAMTAEARLDLSSILGYVGIDEVAELTATNKQEGAACCDMCMCTRSFPPQCQCTDIKPKCHSECKMCRCTRSKPPQCRCMDIVDFCYPTCSSSSSNDAAAAIINGIAK